MRLGTNMNQAENTTITLQNANTPNAPALGAIAHEFLQLWPMVPNLITHGYYTNEQKQKFAEEMEKIMSLLIDSTEGFCNMPGCVNLAPHKFCLLPQQSASNPNPRPCEYSICLECLGKLDKLECPGCRQPFDQAKLYELVQPRTLLFSVQTINKNRDLFDGWARRLNAGHTIQQVTDDEQVARRLQNARIDSDSDEEWEPGPGAVGGFNMGVNRNEPIGRPPRVPVARSRYAITFGEQAETRSASGFRLGNGLAARGFSAAMLEVIRQRPFARTEMYYLHELLPQEHRAANEASVLVLRNGSFHYVGFNPDVLLGEVSRVEFDTRAYDARHNRTHNLLARHNTIFGPTSIAHSEDYRQPSVVGWDSVPELEGFERYVNNHLMETLGANRPTLEAEGNHYYSHRSGIGFHGDSERKIVICLSLGASSTLRFYARAPNSSLPAGGRSVDITLNHGDVYIMSEKATGYDWKSRSRYRFVHAAGAGSYIRLPTAEVADENGEEAPAPAFAPANNNANGDVIMQPVAPVPAQPAAPANNNARARIPQAIADTIQYCAQTGGPLAQRTFNQLLAYANLQRDSINAGIDSRDTGTMDLPTVRNQMGVIHGLRANNKVVAGICRLRMGDLYDRGEALRVESGGEMNIQVGEQTVSQHFTTFMEYIKKSNPGLTSAEENNIRASHQFFQVWKIFKPIMNIFIKPEAPNSWTWLCTVLTRDKLLKAVQEFIRQPPIPAPPREVSLVLRTPCVGTVQVLNDSFYLPKFVRMDDAVRRQLDIVDFNNRELPEMRYRCNPLRRDKWFMVDSPDVSANGEPLTLFKYTYPGFQYRSLLLYHAWSKFPLIQQFFTALAEQFTYCGAPVILNHAIGTRYGNNGEDEIGYHHDKTRDITEGSPIVSISCGDSREFHFCKPGGEDSEPDFIQVLEEGDVFILGPETNKNYKHSIAPLAKERRIVRNGPPQPRTSIVLRNIKTAITRAELLRKIQQNVEADEE